MPKRIVIADDHELFREGLKMVLKKETQLTIVGEAANGEELISIVSKTKPDLVITDINMPKMDGIEATRKLKTLYQKLPIIILTMFDDEQKIIDALEAGAIGYLTKNATQQNILEAIKAGLENKPYYDDAATTKLAQIIASHAQWLKNTPAPAQFSDREIQIIGLMCEAYSNKEIAQRLKLTVRTIESYREKIMDKMGVKNMAGLIIYAIRKNIFQVR